MKLHITTEEGTEGVLKKKKIFKITCHIVLTPEEARIFPDCGTTIDELTPVYEYLDKEETIPNVLRLRWAVEEQSILKVRSLGQLQECEEMIIERCLQVQQLLTELQNFEVEKSYTVDLIERIKDDKKDANGGRSDIAGPWG